LNLYFNLLSLMASKTRPSPTKQSPKSMTTSVTRVILVRHGETDWNVIHRLQGVTDTHLTETGIKQAERVAARLAKSKDVSMVYSSNLTRALKTAQEIVKARSLDEAAVVIDERLREFDLGMFAGHSQVRKSSSRWGIVKLTQLLDEQNEAKRKFPVEWNEHIENNDYIIPNGESYNQFIERTTTVLQDIRKRHEGETVCVVTHGGVIDCARNFLAADSMVDGRCGNASVSEFHAHPDGSWTIHKWNDVSHLAALHKKVLLADDVVQHAPRKASAVSSTSSSSSAGMQ
jgi:probable phosphoglycerate mutase